MAKDAHTFHFSTRAIHAGEKPDPATGPSAPNIVMSTTFVAEPGGSFSAEDFGEATPFIYTRWGNPTVDQLERKLASLEGPRPALPSAAAGRHHRPVPARPEIRRPPGDQ